MGKKGTKKKTVWRTLSIGESGGDDPTNTTTTHSPTSASASFKSINNKKDIRRDVKNHLLSNNTDNNNPPKFHHHNHHNYNNHHNHHSNQNGNHHHQHTTSKSLSSTSSELSNNENRNSVNTTTGITNGTAETTNQYTTNNSNGHHNHQYSNNYNHGYSKYNKSNGYGGPQSSSSSQQQSYPSYKRRPFNTRNYNNGYGEGGGSGGGGGHYRSNYRYRYNNYDNGKEATTNGQEKKESSFNEDEYTRITTPRQDVLFKKGYLSKPKKFSTTPILSTSDANTTTSSSGAVSVVSTEDSTTPSAQSVSPENFSNSIPEDFASLMYPSFVHQNGLLYVNPYLSNGFDTYNHQMMMMPYSSANCQTPFNPYQFYDSPSPQGDGDTNVEFDVSNTEDTITLEPQQQLESSNENGTVIVNSESGVDQIENGLDECVPQDNMTESIVPPVSFDENDEMMAIENTNVETNGDDVFEECTKNDESVDPIIEQPTCVDESVENQCHETLDVDKPPFYPQVFYPYMYCPPHMLPLSNGMSFCNSVNDYGVPSYENCAGNKHFRFKKRKRKPPRKVFNSTGATTDDYSEDESTDNDPHHHHHHQHHYHGGNYQTFIPDPYPTEYYGTDVPTPSSIYDIGLITPASATIIAEHSNLNVEVQEFLPRNYYETHTTTIDSNADEEIVIKKNAFEEQIEKIHMKKTNDDVFTVKIPDDVVTEKKPDEIKDVVVPAYSNVLKSKTSSSNSKKSSSSPQKSTPPHQKVNNKKTAKKTSNTPQITHNKKTSSPSVAENQSLPVEIKEKQSANEPTYAQMLNGKRAQQTAVMTEDDEKNLVCAQDVQKSVKNQPTVIVATTTVIDEVKIPPPTPKWVTVKPKGKRGKVVEIDEDELIVDDGVDEPQKSDTIVAIATPPPQSPMVEPHTLSLSTTPLSKTVDNKPPSSKPSSKSKNHKNKPKRNRNAQTTNGGFEVIEPKFEKKSLKRDKSSIAVNETTVTDENDDHQENGNDIEMEDERDVVNNIHDDNKTTDDVVDTKIESLHLTLDDEMAARLDEINLEMFAADDLLDKDFDIIESESISSLSSADTMVDEHTASRPSSPQPPTCVASDELKQVEENDLVVVVVENGIESDSVAIDRKAKQEETEELNSVRICDSSNGIVEHVAEVKLVNHATVQLTRPVSNGFCNEENDDGGADDLDGAQDSNVVVDNFVMISKVIDVVDDDEKIRLCNKLNNNDVLKSNENVSIPCDKTDEPVETEPKTTTTTTETKTVAPLLRKSLSPSPPFATANGSAAATENFPVTSAVTRWLAEKIKEKTPEPILRLPDDPIISAKIQLNMIDRLEFVVLDDDGNGDGDEWATTDDDDEVDIDDPIQNDGDVIKTGKPSKNLKSNPLRVSSNNSSIDDLNSSTVILMLDTDSDYMSDNAALKLEERTCKRVANRKSSEKYLSRSSSSKTTTTTKKSSSNDENDDLLQYWDMGGSGGEDLMIVKRRKGQDINNIKDLIKLNNRKKYYNDDDEDDLDDIGAYDSVYGKTIDYVNLLSSADPQLSNNILDKDINNLRTNQNTSTPPIEQQQQLDNDNIKPNDNCIKPPFIDVCCILM